LVTKTSFRGNDLKLQYDKTPEIMRRQVIKREEYEAVPKVDTNETFGGQNIQTMS
jgi:hypothetical protein